MERTYTFNRASRSVISALFIAGVPVGFIAPRFAEIKAGIDATAGQFGTAFAFGALGALIGNNLGAQAVHHFGTRKVARIIFYFALVQNVLNAIAPNVELLGINAVFGGLCYSICFVALNSQGVLVEQHLRRSFMPKAHSFFSLATVAGAFISSLVAPYISVLHTLLAADIACAVGWYFLTKNLLAPEYDDRPHDDPTQLQKAEKLPSRVRKFLMWIALGQAFALWAEISVGDWSSVVLREDFKIAVGPNGYGFTTFAIVQLVTRYIAPRFIDKQGLDVVIRRWGIIGSLGYIVFLIGAKLSAGSGSLLTLILACLAYGFLSFGLAAMAPAFATASGGIPGLPSARALMVVGMIGAFVGLIGRIAFSYFAQATSISFALIFIGVIAFIAALAGPLLNPKRVKDYAITR